MFALPISIQYFLLDVDGLLIVDKPFRSILDATEYAEEHVQQAYQIVPLNTEQLEVRRQAKAQLPDALEFDSGYAFASTTSGPNFDYFAVYFRDSHRLYAIDNRPGISVISAYYLGQLRQPIADTFENPSCSGLPIIPLGEAAIIFGDQIGELEFEHF